MCRSFQDELRRMLQPKFLPAYLRQLTAAWGRAPPGMGPVVVIAVLIGLALFAGPLLGQVCRHHRQAGGGPAIPKW